MTKRDFVLVAETIRGLRDEQMLADGDPSNPYYRFSEGDIRRIALRFAEALKGTSPRFNAERFMRACLAQHQDLVFPPWTPDLQEKIEAEEAKARQG